MGWMLLLSAHQTVVFLAVFPPQLSSLRETLGFCLQGFLTLFPVDRVHRGFPFNRDEWNLSDIVIPLLWEPQQLIF